MPDATKPALPFPSAFAFSPLRNTPISAWLGHGPFALWLVETMRPGTVVELGTHRGYSFFAFCQAMDDLGLPGAVHAVDTWQGDKHAGLYDDDVHRSVEAVVAKQFPETGRLHRMTFDAARPQFGEATVDILHIDGLHTYDAVRHDYENWRGTVREGGVILFHDTREMKEDFGVWKLWQELSATHPAFEFHHSHGLGILGVGDSFPEELAWLFALDPASEEAAKARSQFARLGEPLELVQTHRRHIDALERREAKRIGALETRIADMETRIADIEKSRSWRLTAPLRMGEKMIRNAITQMRPPGNDTSA